MRVALRALLAAVLVGTLLVAGVAAKFKVKRVSDWAFECTALSARYERAEARAVDAPWIGVYAGEFTPRDVRRGDVNVSWYDDARGAVCLRDAAAAAAADELTPALCGDGDVPSGPARVTVVHVGDEPAPPPAGQAYTVCAFAARPSADNATELAALEPEQCTTSVCVPPPRGLRLERHSGGQCGVLVAVDEAHEVDVCFNETNGGAAELAAAQLDDADADADAAAVRSVRFDCSSAGDECVARRHHYADATCSGEPVSSTVFSLRCVSDALGASSRRWNCADSVDDERAQCDSPPSLVRSVFVGPQCNTLRTPDEGSRRVSDTCLALPAHFFDDTNDDDTNATTTTTTTTNGTGGVDEPIVAEYYDCSRACATCTAERRLYASADCTGDAALTESVSLACASEAMGVFSTRFECTKLNCTPSCAATTTIAAPPTPWLALLLVALSVSSTLHSWH